MILPIAAAFAFVVGAATPAAPLREVVYKATFSRRSNRVQEVFGGNRPDPYGSHINVTSDSGTITVDVMAVADDGMATRVTEQFGNVGRPQTTFVIVRPDGTLQYGETDLNDATVALLPFFGIDFVKANQSLDVGASWVRNIAGPGINIDSKFTVMRIDGSIVTLAEVRTIKNRTAQGFSATISGSVDYKPKLLCPVAGSLTERTSNTGLDYAEDITLSLQFERVSDTRDPLTKGP